MQHCSELVVPLHDVRGCHTGPVITMLPMNSTQLLAGSVNQCNARCHAGHAFHLRAQQQLVVNGMTT